MNPSVFEALALNSHSTVTTGVHDDIVKSNNKSYAQFHDSGEYVVNTHELY
jgi:hypothetical protein